MHIIYTSSYALAMSNFSPRNHPTSTHGPRQTRSIFDEIGAGQPGAIGFSFPFPHYARNVDCLALVVGIYDV